MGWLEMKHWLAQMNRQRTPPEPSADQWDDASEANFADLRAQRDRMRGHR